ncbi:hypothetical protein TIFTF001_040503 [Ficus carica]|uniref:Uncharacterized protein n=1 Tax=Ficus carica TaxID=3494 RepID=A0AA87Z9L3_FICCA|nr:hypothetical protein TIFTF001_040503 [Ficus carica]
MDAIVAWQPQLAVPYNQWYCDRDPCGTHSTSSYLWLDRPVTSSARDEVLALQMSDQLRRADAECILGR